MALREVASGRGDRSIVAGVVAVVCAATLLGLIGGPYLGDHEALVAQCARNMRLSGDWIVPQFLDTPFVRKPPLNYWLVAALSYVLPAERSTGLPVNEAAARLPSALAALGMVLLLWKLGSSMFGRQTGWVAALVAATCVFTLLYAPNATAEMTLTFCCTWAFVHFWYAARPRVRWRIAHVLLFYVALGAGMLAKGPAPLSLVCVPLAVWWYTHRPHRVLVRGGRRAGKRALALLGRELWAQTVRAFTRLWVFPGVVIFLCVFVPWMLAVAHRVDHTWELWNWQYLQRFQGDYEDTRERGFFYYVPILLGLAAPWTPWLLHGVVMPWLKRTGRELRACYFLLVWGIVGVIVMSVMDFKKPYYIAPALPGLLLLASLPVRHFFLVAPPKPTRAWVPLGVAGAVLAASLLIGGTWLRMEYAGTPAWIALAGLPMAITFLAAVGLFTRGSPRPALFVGAAGMVIGFVTSWQLAPHVADNLVRTRRLANLLESERVPSGARLYWADRRPDSRLAFYYGRRSMYLVPPAEVVSSVVNRKGEGKRLEAMALARLESLLAEPEATFIIVKRESLPLLSRLSSPATARISQVGAVDAEGAADGDDWILLVVRAGASISRAEMSGASTALSRAPKRFRLLGELESGLF